MHYFSARKSNNFSVGVFFIGIGILAYTNFWWPGILLVLAVALAIRQGMRGRIYDSVISFIIFAGLFVYEYIDAQSRYFLPVLFVTAGIYLIFREYICPRRCTEIEREEDLQHEMEENE